MKKLALQSLVLSGSVLGLASCIGQATLPVSAGMGPEPQLPAPRSTLIPTVKIAPAQGWANGVSPVPVEATRC